MQYEISKELLSEVLGVNVTKVGEIFGGVISFETDNISGLAHTLNIYELINICKEWTKKFNNSIYYRNQKTTVRFRIENHTSFIGVKDEYWVDCMDRDWFMIKRFKSDTEQQAVIKATQWILDNKDK